MGPRALPRRLRTATSNMIPANYFDARLPLKFWAKIIPCPMTGCWLWVGGCTTGGYGTLGAAHRMWLAHRFVYTELIGAIPSGLELDHRCKVRCCVNPTHLEPVTNEENRKRSPTNACALNAAKTICKRGHSLSDAIIRANPNGRRMRVCRECNRLDCRARISQNSARRREKRKASRASI